MRIGLLYAFLRVEALVVYTAFGYRSYLSQSLAKFGKGIYRQVPSRNANCAEVLDVTGKTIGLTHLQTWGSRHSPSPESLNLNA